MNQGWLQIALVLVVAFAISIPLGRYIARTFTGQRTFLDPVMDPIDNGLYWLVGRNVTDREMNWKTYVAHMLAVNFAMVVILFLILRFQNFLPLNPMHFPGMEPTQAFNTAASFVTNTNWQSYSGESTLSIFSQMTAIIFPMFTSAATGFVLAMAFIRALVTKDRGRNLGNYYRDMIRFITRVVMIPSILLALILVWQGVPQTLDASVTAHALGGGTQTISMGPVAALETIKHLGTNGGGFFNANSAHPFENPTPLTDVLEMLMMAVIPLAIVIAFGEMIGKKRQAWTLYAVMGAMLVGFVFMAVLPEQAGTPLLQHAGIQTQATLGQPGGNMEGKEVRFGIAQSSFFATLTTSFTTGTVNSMHDSYTPVGGMTPLVQMMLNCVFGGKGVGFLNIIMYSIFAVFLTGLMVGRTPEFLGKKIEKREVVLASLALLMHPLIILIPSAWSVIAPYGVSSLNNAAMHGLSEIVYAYTSGAANNGSAFAGLNANTPWYNLSIGLVILLGRYISIIFMLAIAGSLAAKPTIPETAGTMRTDTPLFGALLLFTVLLVGALTFFPALVLGPIAEQFAMHAGQVF